MNRQWQIAAGVAFIVVAIAGGLYLHLQEYEPDRSRFPIRGIDVSHHQGRIDWAKVVKDDVSFAYIKVSEGGDHRDREFVRNIAEANKLGLPVGIYHFFTFCRPGADQAKNFVEAVPPAATQLPPVADLEFQGNCPRRPSKEELGREVRTFLQIVESRYDRPVMYYLIDDLAEAYGDALPQRQRWTRSIRREPGHENWVVWQYLDSGRVAGIAGDVDLNVLSGSLDALMKANPGRFAAD